MARLLEETGAAGLGLTELLGRLPVGVGEKLTRLVARGVHDLGALALALLAEPFDLRLAPPELGLPPPNLLLGLAELGRRRALGVPLEDIGELGRLADQVQGVEATWVLSGNGRSCLQYADSIGVFQPGP